MDVRTGLNDSGVLIFRGPLREAADVAFQKLKLAFGGESVPLLQEDAEMGAAVLVIPRPVERAVLERTVHPWLNWLLFAATIVTTTWVGAAYVGVNLAQEPGRFAAGLPYAIGLLGVLGVHEMGHFFAARRHGMNVTPPYFIPVPFALGTFGAFIKMRSPSEDRRSLFDVAVAGPLAGLVIAIPALLIGLHQSELVAGGTHAAATSGLPGMGQPSILFALLARISPRAGGIPRECGAAPQSSSPLPAGFGAVRDGAESAAHRPARRRAYRALDVWHPHGGDRQQAGHVVAVSAGAL